ncbi:hypothetical protein [Promicromonospora sp. NPDC050262]|uniref:hypothetical protein n=1 Tax=Promicromonospora sp. NPDC050262 TaxID=3155036 RepID=UPI0033EECFFA
MSEEPAVLFADPRDTTEPGPIELAAKQSIDAMREFGAIDATHALKIALIMAGSRALDREFHRDKVTVAATTLFSRVVDIADGLPTVQQAVSEQFAALTKSLQDAV